MLGVLNVQKSSIVLCTQSCMDVQRISGGVADELQVKSGWSNNI